jgi:REP element-mobilizing transposase RayT
VRSPRIQFPGAIHHVYSRGNGKQKIFTCGADFRYFLKLLASAVSKHSWQCHSYCLMDTHYHLVIETNEVNLAEGMQFLNGTYGGNFNRVHDKVGHVMQGRYHSPLISSDPHFLELLRYTALNPVKAHLVRLPAEWPWSSYRALAGLSPGPEWLETSLSYSLFNPSPSRAQVAYGEFVADRLQDALSGDLEDRPSVRQLLSNVGTRQERNRALFVAHNYYGFNMSDLAGHLNISLSAVSRAIAKHRQLEIDEGGPKPALDP